MFTLTANSSVTGKEAEFLLHNYVNGGTCSTDGVEGFYYVNIVAIQIHKLSNLDGGQPQITSNTAQMLARVLQQRLLLLHGYL